MIMPDAAATPSTLPPAEIAVPDLEFEMGGPAYRLMQRIGIVQGSAPSVGRRSLAFILVTWVPLLLLSFWQGTAIGPTPRASLLLDFATYARLFVAIPLIFAAESVAGPRLRAAGLRFLEGGLVRPESHADFDAAVARVRRRRESVWPELIFLVFAAFGAWFLSLERLTGIGDREANWAGTAAGLLPAGLWYQFVVVPLIQFFVLRWIWRWIIWSLFLRDVSRLKLNLMVTHTDMSAGVGFLGQAHVAMAIFPVAVSTVLAAELAFRVVFEGMTLRDLQGMLPLLVGYLLFVEVLIFGPLLIFTPVLAAARRTGLRTYGVLVQRHNQAFHDKWITAAGGDESPLGNQDMSSLVDLGSSYLVIREMNIVPVSRRQMMQVAGVACLPGVPLLFLALPVMDVIRLLLGVVV